jgi:protein CpxP
MKHRIITLTSLTAVAVLGLAVLARAGGEAQAGKESIRARLAELGITPEQRTQLREACQRQWPTAQPLLTQVVAQRRALRDLVRAEKFDEAAIRAQAAKVAAVEADLAVVRAKLVADVRPILTPAQIEKVHELRDAADDRLDAALARAAKWLSD